MNDINNGVFAIIVTYNSDLKILTQQFLSLINQVDGVIYVDNGSKNYESILTVNKQSTFFEKVWNISQISNVGLGKAQNIGIKKAIKLGAKHILLLDHDSVLEESFVSNLLFAESKYLDKKINVGIVGPIFFNQATNIFYPIIIKNGVFEKKIIDIQNDVYATFIIASGMLIRKEVFEDLGMMNEELFVDMIDNEWCARVTNKGYKIIVTPTARMSQIIGDRRINFMGRNMSSHSPLRRYYLCRNSLLMFRFKYVNIFSCFRELFKTILRLFVVLIIGPDRLKYLKFCMRGFYDGILGHIGQCPI